jgi:hypothetical protein
MCYREHKCPGGLDPVHETERKPMKRISAKVKEVNRPALRRILYGVNRPPKSVVELFCSREVPVAIPSQRIQVIFFRTGMKLQRLDWHRLLPVQQRLPFPLDLAPRNGLDLSRPNLIHAPGYLLLPDSLGVLIHGLI